MDVTASADGWAPRQLCLKQKKAKETNDDYCDVRGGRRKLEYPYYGPNTAAKVL